MLKRLIAAAALVLAAAARPAALPAQESVLPAPALAVRADPRLIAPVESARPPAPALAMSRTDLVWTGGLLGAIAGPLLFYALEGHDNCGGPETMFCGLGYPVFALGGVIVGAGTGFAIGALRN